MVRWPWAVIGVWVAMAIALPLAVPCLGEMAEKHPLAILPSDAPSSVTAQKMAEAFHEPGNDDLLVIALINEDGLGPRRRSRPTASWWTRCATTSADVVMVQDFITHATTAPVPDQQGQDDLGVASRPCRRVGHAAGLRGSFNRVTDIVEHSIAGSPTTVHVTGPAATVADLTVAGRTRSHADRDRDRRPGARRAVAGVPQPGHHAAAIGDDRGVVGDRAGRGGRLL